MSDSVQMGVEAYKAVNRNWMDIYMVNNHESTCVY